MGNGSQWNQLSGKWDFTAGSGATNASGYGRLYLHYDPNTLSVTGYVDVTGLATGTPLYGYSETDPTFTNWLGTNTYVKAELDVTAGALGTNALLTARQAQVLATNAYAVGATWAAASNDVQTTLAGFVGSSNSFAKAFVPDATSSSNFLSLTNGIVTYCVTNGACSRVNWRSLKTIAIGADQTQTIDRAWGPDGFINLETSVILALDFPTEFIDASGAASFLLGYKGTNPLTVTVTNTGFVDGFSSITLTNCGEIQFTKQQGEETVSCAHSP
jgi:hypothetical protein